MKKIEFKRIPKDLIEEGITIDLLNKVQDIGKFSPAMIQKGDDPVVLIKANSKQFWIKLEDGSFLKDNGKLVKVDIKNCIIARARYWLLFSQEETTMDEERKAKAKEPEIQKEVERIQADVKKKAEAFIERCQKILNYADESDELQYAILKSYDVGLYEKRVADAKDFLARNPGIREFIGQLEEWLEKSDFDSLYMTLESDGMPLITSMNNAVACEVLPRFFHASKIESTMETIKRQSHIKNVAIFNVNKRYV